MAIEALEKRNLLTLPPSYVADVQMDVDYSLSIVVNGQTSTMTETLPSRTVPLLSNPSEYQQVPDGNRVEIGPLRDEKNFESETGNASLSGSNGLAFLDNKPGILSSMSSTKSISGDFDLGSPAGTTTAVLNISLTVLPNAKYPSGTPIQLQTIFTYESRDLFECLRVESVNCDALSDSTLDVSASAKFLSQGASAPFEVSEPAGSTAFLFDIGGPRTTLSVGSTVTLQMAHSINGVLSPEDEFRKSDLLFNVLLAAPPPAPVIQIVKDGDIAGAGHLKIDAFDPVTQFVRVGLWDNAYEPIFHSDDLHRIKNSAAEIDNFVGADSQRFYFRVFDPVANRDPDQKDVITINWHTTTKSGQPLDQEGDTTLTLVETEAGSGVFVSKAVMLVAKSYGDADGDGEADDVDWRYPTHNGFGPADGKFAPTPELALAGEANHRTRRATIGSQVIAEYDATWPNSDPVTTSATVFREQERRVLPLIIFSFLRPDTGVPFVSDEQITQHLLNAQNIWLPAAIEFRPSIQKVPAPPTAFLERDDGSYVFDEKNPVLHATMEQFIVQNTPDGSLSVVFAANLISGSTGQAWIFSDIGSGIGDRGFSYISATAKPEGGTLAHELFHLLYNREDIRINATGSDHLDVPPHFFTFNTNQNRDYGTPSQMDVRVRRRFHPNTIDWETPGEVWAHRTRTRRFEPLTGPALPAEESTGHTYFGTADPVEISIGNDAVIEGDDGTTSLNFKVNLSDVSLEPISVDFATRANSAHFADDDYVRALGTLTFAPAEREQSIQVRVRGDRRHEADEFLFVNLSNARGAAIANNFGFGVIVNDDQDVPIPPWQNPLIQWDVSKDGDVSSLDALLILNYLISVDGNGELGSRPADSTEPCYDVNGDGRASSLDALIVINRLRLLEFEGEEVGFQPLRANADAVDRVHRDQTAMLF